MRASFNSAHGQVSEHLKFKSHEPRKKEDLSLIHDRTAGGVWLLLLLISFIDTKRLLTEFCMASIMPDTRKLEKKSVEAYASANSRLCRIVANGITLDFHMLPSGLVNPSCMNLIGSGVVFHGTLGHLSHCATHKTANQSANIMKSLRSSENLRC